MGMKIQKLKRALKSEAFRKVRMIVVAVAGTAVILAGILLLFLPGPAFVVIPAGFGILAIEFDWARSWMRKTMEWVRYLSSPKTLKKILYENSLSLALFFLFAVCLTGQILTGHRNHNLERQDHGQSKLSFREYIVSGHAIEATFENWESEFLQMGALVLLTVFLRQKGAADSQKVNGEKRRGALHTAHRANAPWPVRKGGWVLKTYKHSLSLSLLALFLLSFCLHAAGGRLAYNEDQIRHGERALSLLQYMSTSRFWFESFQNWQSEFLSVGVLLLLSIFLREKGSPQSKRVNEPYFETEDHEPGIAAAAHPK
jgi:hypothetical protein